MLGPSSTPLLVYSLARNSNFNKHLFSIDVKITLVSRTELRCLAFDDQRGSAMGLQHLGRDFRAVG
jgi:hypothetical protein